MKKRKTKAKSKPKKKYSVSRSIRYHGDLTSYRVLVKHKNALFHDSAGLEPFFDRTTPMLLKKAYASPLSRKYGKIRRVTAAVKGIGHTEDQNNDQSHDFPLWEATTDYAENGLNKTTFTETVYSTREAVKKDLQNLFTQAATNRYHADSSSSATSIKIEESILYVETIPIKKHTKPAKSKKRGRKNSDVRPRNARLGKSRKRSRV